MGLEESACRCLCCWLFVFFLLIFLLFQFSCKWCDINGEKKTPTIQSADSRYQSGKLQLTHANTREAYFSLQWSNIDVWAWTIDGDLQEQVAVKPTPFTSCVLFRANGLFDWLQLVNSTAASVISSESYICVSIHVSFYCFWLKSIDSNCTASRDTRHSADASEIQTAWFEQGDIGTALVIITIDSNTYLHVHRYGLTVNFSSWPRGSVRLTFHEERLLLAFFLLSHNLHPTLLRYAPLSKGPHLSQPHEPSIKCTQEAYRTFTQILRQKQQKKKSKGNHIS